MEPEKQANHSDTQAQGQGGQKIEHFSLNLPKGGGAIRGMGEKFQANAVTGTGSLNVPLPISPGRGGFSPHLAISYNSGSGNSPFGLGWAMDLPAITRKTDKTLPTYNDAEDGDTFILSGAEDLMPVLEETAGKWQKNIREEQVFDQLSTINYRISAYRPRVEGLFARIEKWCNTETHEMHWQATTKDNITSIYGKTPQARIADPDNPAKIFSWLIEETFDAKGQRIEYEYKPENSQNISNDMVESQRLHAASAFQQRYVKRVTYSPFAADQSRFHFQLLFDYGEHTTDSPEEITTWPVRQDPFSEYKPGFEVRTYRLCQRVLMFHNFPKTGYPDDWQLVKATELAYEEKPTLTYLISATQRGYQRQGNTYITKTLPPLEFKYIRPEIDPAVQVLDAQSRGNLPVGLDMSAYQWVDLEGEGLSGILTHQADALYYKDNLGNGHFGDVRALATIPQPIVTAGQPLQVTDINSDGVQELVVRGDSLKGYFEYQNGQWQDFIPFEKNPQINFKDPNLKMIDLTGDGRPDLLITEEDALTWYPSDGIKGYDEAIRNRKPCQEEQGPALVFADSTQSIFLADMSGDGLTDIVRIRNGEVCYWPNLGYGRFGKKVQMAHAPRFSLLQEKFNPRNIQLGDLDGSGTTDIFYFGNAKVEYWLNQAGNSFSPRQEIDFPLPIDSLTSLAIIDFTATGTMNLVWSTRRPGMDQHQLSYIELMRQKPHLMYEINNNLGKLTRISYAPSSRYYLADKMQGTPWITKLAFPVQVLDKVETLDLISGSRLVSQYTYHHGYYDTFEREFRGFGRVETLDTETFEDYTGDPKHFVAPILTKSWFHTGAYVQAGLISRQYEKEYYHGDSKAFLLPDTIIEDQDVLDAVTLREAHRALKSSALRQEIYELGKEAPYQVTEANFNVKTLQPIGDNKHAVFFTHAHESLTFHYEQNPADPRISHDFQLEVDEFGNTLKSCSLVYPRRFGADTLPEQQAGHVTVAANHFINHTQDFYLIGVPCQTRNYEVQGLTLSPLNQVLFNELKPLVEQAITAAIPYGQEFTASTLQARLFQWQRHYYWDQYQNLALPLGEITAQALQHHSETAVFTPDVVQQAYQGQVSATLLGQAGYILADGYYWNPGLTQRYSSGNFYLPTKTEDPFGGGITITYDEYCFMPIETSDSLGNTSLAKIDYRTLQPWQLIDPNDNKSEAIADAMGMVMATSIYGAEQGTAKGDSPLFNTNGEPIYQVQPEASITLVLANPAQYLQTATTFFHYDLDAWRMRSEPPQSILIARETHVSELASGQTTLYQRTIAYSDGFGRALQTKIMVEPGTAWVKQPDQSFQEQWVAERWLASGRTVYNNKEKPIKQYEPFYTAASQYEPEEFFANYGVTPVLHYDPLLRVIRTDTPKGFFSKVEFTPWQISKYDENDTVAESDYYQKYLQLLPDEQEALNKALAHAHTPHISRLDTLGREFTIIENLLALEEINSGNKKDQQLITYTTFNIAGKPVTITDPRQMATQSGLKTFQYTYDMNQQVLRTLNIDAGDDKVLANVLGKPVYSSDKRGYQIIITYDLLQRPITTRVNGNGLDNIVERLIYGESLADAKARNMRTRLYQHYDQSGLNEIALYTFKGQPGTANHRIRTEYKAEANWPDNSNWSSLLASETFITLTQYDALGRVLSQQQPDGSSTMPVFHPSGKLNQVKVKLKGETTYTQFVASISYNPKGQREVITYGNYTQTTYAYERETFRLISLKTLRQTDNQELQNILYTYDPVGNITKIIDHSNERVFHNNQVVDPEHKYTYDALYRLLEANGREHIGLNTPDYYKKIGNFKQSAFINLTDPNDSNKLANYTEKYSYDQAGNLYQLKHIAADSTRSYTRDIAVDSMSNRAILKEADQPVNFADYFDVNGNCTKLENIAELAWNYRDNISQAIIVKRTSGQNDAEYYVYDSQGNRTRKVKETYLSSGTLEIEEKIYLGGVEIKRIRQNTMQLLNRSSLHVMDDKKRIALVHNWAQDTNLREISAAADLNKNKTRYQFENHLGSASLELDEQGLVISYEEYFPYGGTSFIAGTSQAEAKLKEYRYSGKERDDSTGLYYYGARYYAPWLGRWMSADPLLRNYQPKDENGRHKPLKFINHKYSTMEMSNQINPIDPEGQTADGYLYCKSNPMLHTDLFGLVEDDGKWVVDKENPVWNEKDNNYSAAVQAKLLELNYKWFFAENPSEQLSIVNKAENIRQKFDSGPGKFVDQLSKNIDHAIQEISVIQNESIGSKERNYWLAMNQVIGSNIKIDSVSDKILAGTYFIAGMLMGGGEGKAFQGPIKGWIKHSTYNEVRNLLGKEGIEKFVNAMKKGIVGAKGESGIKLLAGKGIEYGGKFYKYELKVLSKGMSHYRILGNFDKKTGKLIFERLINKK